jgi:hypothetical protein
MAKWQSAHNWDKVEPKKPGEYSSIEPGAYICKIISARFQLSKNNNEMLVIDFDIAGGQYLNYYAQQFEQWGDGNEENWRGKYRQMTGIEKGGESLSFFKGLITTLEASNGLRWDETEEWFRGKAFAGVFGEEEYLDRNGELKVSTKLRYINDAHNIDYIKPLTIKKLKQNNGYQAGYTTPRYNAPPQASAYAAQPTTAYSTTPQQSQFVELDDDSELPF